MGQTNWFLLLTAPEKRSSASGVEGAFVEKAIAVRLLYGEGDKVTRETDVKQSKRDALSRLQKNPT
ncbi:hypothetical protein SynBIOSU31_00050 [Synechococcus sp. BIOS-U3-1]|uniref:hypothetical protein n=1 Tax=Synechococcus sp. BIOS-U3-1 TaxID=1400865 RepID=UPI001644FA3A|nr:hypothetical protein [Synechococcus sp. BIOS-U3-1]QNI56973.1 hypothetical protein SynBIOSU31_00050 [Synechococcus sp. BIOS-U3-1]